MPIGIGIARLGVALAFFASPAVAGTSYTCANADLVDVTCADGACEAKGPGTFSPLVVAIDGYDELQVCDEAGCWRGLGKRQISGAYEIVTGVDLAWSGRGRAENDAVLVFDPETGMGTILAPPYFSPIHCMVHPGE